MDSEKQSEGFEMVGGGWEVGIPGGRYYSGQGLHGALGVVQI